MILEPLAAEVRFGQLVALDHRPHRAVEDEDARFERAGGGTRAEDVGVGELSGICLVLGDHRVWPPTLCRRDSKPAQAGFAVDLRLRRVSTSGLRCRLRP